MTNKQRFIRAFKATIHKYKHPIRRMFFDKDDCSICDLVEDLINGEFSSGLWSHGCYPCPMANSRKDEGCSDFRSYNKLAIELKKAGWDGDDRIKKEYLTPGVKAAIGNRIKALQKMIKIMEKWPEERFTEGGWIYSGKEIPRSW